jgi:chromosome segregation ATPase
MAPPEAAWAPPPQNWQPQQSFYPQEGEEITDFQQIQRALDETLARESELIGQVQNMTSSIATFQQREDLHTRQLDVLTERVMDAEAQTASERNALVEYEANCTELGHALAVLQDEIQEWQYKCANLTARHEADEEKLMDMLAEVKARNAEVEQFATIVEKSRLADERDRYMAERIRKKKQRGFFAWLFGIGDNLDDEEERLQVR